MDCVQPVPVPFRSPRHGLEAQDARESEDGPRNTPNTRKALNRSKRRERRAEGEKLKAEKLKLGNERQTADRRGGPAAPRAADRRRRRVGREEAQEAQNRSRRGHRDHGARTQRKQETNRPEPERSPRNTRKDLNRRKRRERRTEDGGRGTDFTGGNRENGGCFFIRAIRVIRGEKVWNVGRKKAQEAQKKESGGDGRERNRRAK